MTEIDELSEIVEKFKKPLRLHDGDVKLILLRLAYLKQKLGTTGIADFKLVLTSIYCYTRTPRYGRKIVGASRFVHLCKYLDFSFTGKDLWRCEQLYFQHGLYQRNTLTNVTSYFEAACFDISKDLALPEAAKDRILSLLKELGKARGPRRAPQALIGALIYLLREEMQRYVTQRELAEYFGVSEVTIRNVVQELKLALKRYEPER